MHLPYHPGFLPVVDLFYFQLKTGHTATIILQNLASRFLLKTLFCIFCVFYDSPSLVKVSKVLTGLFLS